MTQLRYSILYRTSRYAPWSLLNETDNLAEAVETADRLIEREEFENARVWDNEQSRWAD